MDETFRLFPLNTVTYTPLKRPVTFSSPDTESAVLTAWTTYTGAHLVLEEARKQFEEASKWFQGTLAAKEMRTLLVPQPRSLPTYAIFPEEALAGLRAFVENSLGGEILRQSITTSGYDCGELRYYLKHAVHLGVGVLKWQTYAGIIYELDNVTGPTDVKEVVFRRSGSLVPPYAKKDWDEMNGRG